MKRIDEIRLVKQLGEQVGYGNLMNLASALWAIDLESKDYPVTGAFVPVISPDIKAARRKHYEKEQNQRKREVIQRVLDREEDHGQPKW